MRKVSHTAGVHYDPDVHRSSTLHAGSNIEQVSCRLLFLACECVKVMSRQMPVLQNRTRQKPVFVHVHALPCDLCTSCVCLCSLLGYCTRWVVSSFCSYMHTVKKDASFPA